MIKQCPVCWGKKVICIGLDDDLEPLTEPCVSCDGTGWLEYKPLEKEEQGRNERSCNY